VGTRLLTVVSIIGLATAFAPAVAQAAPAHICEWEVSDLPLPAGVDRGYVTGSSADGTLVGVVSDGGGEHQVAVWRNGVPTLIGRDGGATEAFDVNDAGDAVGAIYPGVSVATPVIYHNGAWAVLTNGKNAVNGEALSVNNAGQVVAAVYDNSGDHIGVWNVEHPDQVRYLHMPPGEGAIYPAIDERGDIITSTQRGRAFLFEPNGNVTELKPAEPGDRVEARGVHNGHIVGRSGSNGVEWDFTGTVVADLVEDGNAFAVNAADQVVGDSGADHYVWQDGQVDGVLGEPAGASWWGAGTITDAGVAAGSYTKDHPVPAQWSCRG
jgi:hypothetical protein